MPHFKKIQSSGKSSLNYAEHYENTHISVHSQPLQAEENDTKLIHTPRRW